MTICVIGAYSCNNNIFDVGVMLVFGLISYYLCRYGFSVAPLLLAFVLSPTLELQLRLALGISQGDATVFLTRPISCVIVILTIAVLLGPVIKSMLSKRKGSEA